MRKRLLSVAIALMLLLSAGITGGAAGTSFSDVKDEAVLEAVQTLNSVGVIASAEKFNPGGQLTRAMFCAIAVPLSGIRDVTPYKNYTVFPDVRASHWALGYVNAAVKELKLLGPRSNGTFAPDEAITFDEAVTIMVRMLGYNETDLGYNWPRNYLSKAGALGLTDGVKASVYVTRGQGALLFYNMLNINSKGETVSFMEKTLGINNVENALISDVNTTGRYSITLSDGTKYYTHEKPDASLEDKRADLTVDGSSYVIKISPLKTVTGAYITRVSTTGKYGVTLSDDTFYRSRERLDASLEGRWADLIIDKDGYIFEITAFGRTVKNVVMLKTDGENEDGDKGIIVSGTESFFAADITVSETLRYKRVTIVLDDDDKVVSVTPAAQTAKDITAALISSAGITQPNGVTVVIPPSTEIYVGDSSTTYSAAYSSISKNDTLTIYYKAAGAVDYAVWNNEQGDGSDVVTATALKAGVTGLRDALGIKPDGLKFYKNGAETTVDCIQPYDTLRYSGKTVNVSSLRVDAVYPGGTVTEIGGFEFIPAATLQAQKLQYGEHIVLCVSTAGTVGAVFANTEIQSNAMGYLKNGGTIELLNGLTVNSTPEDGIYTGMPVNVSLNIKGETQTNRLHMKIGGEYNVTESTVGKHAVASWCKVYTMSGELVKPVNKSALPAGTITSDRVKHVNIGEGGVEVMIIKDLNGDALSYGYSSFVPATNSGAMIIGLDENAGITLRTYTGTTSKITLNGDLVNDAQRMAGTFVAAELVSVNGDLRVNGISRCLMYTVPVSALSDGSITINGTATPISDECLDYGAYYNRERRTVTIEDLPDILPESGMLTVYCDKAPSIGGKVRWIEIR